jgi:hypothetical protein
VEQKNQATERRLLQTAAALRFSRERISVEGVVFMAVGVG